MKARDSLERERRIVRGEVRKWVPQGNEEYTEERVLSYDLSATQSLLEAIPGGCTIALPVQRIDLVRGCQRYNRSA